MTIITRSLTAVAAMLALAGPAAAQQPADNDPPPAPAGATAAADITDSWMKGRPITMQYYRPQDERGLNVFETTKTPGVAFTGFKLDFGGAFTSQLQDMSHRNTAAPSMVNGADVNQLANIGMG